MACCVCSLKSTWEGWEQWYMYTFSPSTITLGVKGLCGLGCHGTHSVDQSSLKPTETYCLYLLMPLGIKACVTTWQLGSKAFRQYKRKCYWCQWGKQASLPWNIMNKLRSISTGQSCLTQENLNPHKEKEGICGVFLFGHGGFQC